MYARARARARTHTHTHTHFNGEHLAAQEPQKLSARTSFFCAETLFAWRKRDGEGGEGGREAAKGAGTGDGES